jgi:hypothetical protein
VLLKGPLTAEAQAPAKVWRVAVLTVLPRSAAPVRALEQRLAELGYVEGRNLLTIVHEVAHVALSRDGVAASELVAETAALLWGCPNAQPERYRAERNLRAPLATAARI